MKSAAAQLALALYEVHALAIPWSNLIFAIYGVIYTTRMTVPFFYSATICKLNLFQLCKKYNQLNFEKYYVVHGLFEPHTTDISEIELIVYYHSLIS